MWLKLTWYDGTKLRLPIDKCSAYFEGDDKVTQITLNGEGYQIKETVEEIDNAIADPSSPLRVVQTAKGWT